MTTQDNAKQGPSRPSAAHLAAQLTQQPLEKRLLHAIDRSAAEEHLYKIDDQFPRPDTGKNAHLTEALFYILQTRIGEFLDAHSPGKPNEFVPLDDRDTRSKEERETEAAEKLSKVLEFICDRRPEHCGDVCEAVKNLEYIRWPSVCSTWQDSMLALLKFIREHERTLIKKIDEISDDHLSDQKPPKTLVLSLEKANSIKHMAAMKIALHDTVEQILDVLLAGLDPNAN